MGGALHLRADAGAGARHGPARFDAWATTSPQKHPPFLGISGVDCTPPTILEFKLALGRDQDGVLGLGQVRHVRPPAVGAPGPVHAGMFRVWHNAAEAPTAGEQQPAHAVTAPMECLKTGIVADK
jgi:hypothetical protein